MPHRDRGQGNRDKDKKTADKGKREGTRETGQGYLSWRDKALTLIEKRQTDRHGT